MAVAETLKNRHGIHGDYSVQSNLSMALFRHVYLARNWAELSGEQKEALVLILVKIGRILTGDPNAADHWHDIAGYAQLVENVLNGKQANGVVSYADDKAGYVASLKEAPRKASERELVEKVAAAAGWVQPLYAAKQQGESDRNSPCRAGWGTSQG